MPDRDNCQGIIDITSGFVSDQSSEVSESGLAQELFTLSAVGEGQCTFRMAYANVADRNFSFEEYAKGGGLLIKIPITVGSEEIQPGRSRNAARALDVMGV